MAEVKFTSRAYYNAAQEHLKRAVSLRAQGEHFAAHYFAGVAVEAILRAVSVKDGESFDSSHSIEYWAKKARLLLKVSENRQNKIASALLEVNLRWRANQRYYTSKMLDTYLRNTNLDGNIRGDRVKASSGRMLELADIVIAEGVQRWNRQTS